PSVGSDSLIVTSNGATTIDFAAGTITGIVGGTVSLTGIEHLTVHAANNAVTVNGYGVLTDVRTANIDGATTIAVNGTAGADSIAVTPTSATGANIQGGAQAPVLTTDNTGLLTVNGAGGADVLTVNGTSSGE